jgi:hypothetical protein
MKTKINSQNPMMAIRRLAFLALFGAFTLNAGCQYVTPVAGMPITVESRSIYEVQRTLAYYRDDTLYVEGELTLVPGLNLAPYTHFDVKVFDPSGKMVGEADAKLDRNEKNHPGDMRLNASFKARIKVPLAEVARVEAHYIPAA